MSQTVRSYAGREYTTGPSRRRLRRRRMRRILLGVVLAFAACEWWTTRDNYPLEQLIPAKQAYHLFAYDLLGKRDEIANSRIWEALPRGAGGADIRGLLKQNFGMPEWVLKNLIPNICHVSGRDLTGFSDVLFISQTTRIGCLLLKLHFLIPGIACESAGGLHLSRVPEAGIYFAPRGRLFVMSPSRDALIRALTLRPEDALSRETVAAASKSARAGDFQGTILPTPQDPLGEVLQSVRFALRIEPDAVQLKCQGTLHPEWSSRMREFVADLAPQELLIPPDGMLQVSMNFDKPVRDLWKMAFQAAGKYEEGEALWRKGSTPPQGAAPGSWQTALAVLGSLGPGIRLSWLGVDLDEMIPMPQLLFTLDGVSEEIQAAVAALPPLSDGPERYAGRLQYHPVTRCVRLPLIGGPSMEPAAGVLGNTLLLSSSRTVAEALMKGAPKEERLPQPANIWIRIQPRPCLEAVVNMARLLAENNLLRDYSPETIQALAAPWMGSASVVQEIAGFVAYDKGRITAEARCVCTRERVAASPVGSPDPNGPRKS